MTKKNSTYPNLLQLENLSHFDSLFHFSTTIEGGVSKGNYATFNLGIYAGDNPTDVDDNRARLASMIDVDVADLYFPYQLHGSEVCVLDEYFLLKSDLEKTVLLHGIDAVITAQKNICIGVSTADCVPILIFDPQQTVLAAIHAGWRGTVAHIVKKTVERMKESFGCNPQSLIAGIFPSISQDFFEVGDEVVSMFKAADFDLKAIAKQNSKTDKMHIDLWNANKLELEKTGIPSRNIEIAKMCTYENEEMFFSARRQGIKSGRMITGGVLR